MKKWWNDYFYWNRTERRGVIPLLLLMGLLMAANLVLRWQVDRVEEISDPEFLALAKQFEAADSLPGEPWKPGFERKPRYANAKQSIFPGKARRFGAPKGLFDPNGLPAAEWVRLGLSEKQASSVKRFEENGGRFYRKEDLKKLYVISEEFYTHIEPYLVFEDRKKSREEPRVPVSGPIGEKVDINRADSAQLVRLRGITPKMALRILKVREIFGGFHDPAQLNDLYGFRPENYEILRQTVYAGPVTIRPLNLNYCSFKELLTVPGLSYESVKAIMNYREQNGFFKKTEDLVTLNLAEPGLYAKIAPYLTVK